MDLNFNLMLWAGSWLWDLNFEHFLGRRARFFNLNLNLLGRWRDQFLDLDDVLNRGWALGAHRHLGSFLGHGRDDMLWDLNNLDLFHFVGDRFLNGDDLGCWGRDHDRVRHWVRVARVTLSVGVTKLRQFVVVMLDKCDLWLGDFTGEDVHTHRLSRTLKFVGLGDFDSWLAVKLYKRAGAIPIDINDDA